MEISVVGDKSFTKCLWGPGGATHIVFGAINLNLMEILLGDTDGQLDLLKPAEVNKVFYISQSIISSLCVGHRISVKTPWLKLCHVI